MPQPSAAGAATSSPDFVTSFARGLTVIRALATYQRPMTLAEVAESAARRFLITLMELGYATGSDGRFALTPRVLELGYSYLSGMPLPDRVRPHLEAIGRDLQQSAAVAVLDGDDIVYVARVASTRMMRVHIEVGTRLPAHLTSMGRVLLAALPPEELEAFIARVDFTPRTPKSIRTAAALRRELDRVRAEGYALIEGELDDDIRGLSMPLREPSGSVVAAVNVSIHMRGDSTAAIRETFLPRLREAVQAIEADLTVASAGASVAH